MIKFLLFFMPVLLLGERIYDSTLSPENKEAMNNPKIKCRMVCDKKLYRQQEIAEAISFYKRSKEYKFETNQTKEN
ncbi:hypothetical protein FJR03_00160 [Sulfurimonas marina]|uniref:Uncharacterized protein n=2 Tax=Sulfurimonas marina TaxID=2590551 RepID=A0A7M3V904_9BACT|nr:hypothetical protein FJR03_00160 [Sulfurimonas marina]